MNLHILQAIFLSIICSSIGQIFWKIGMNRLGPIISLSLEEMIKVFIQPYIIIGFFFSITGMFFWLISLSKGELSYVYPFIALNFIVILIVSGLFFHENISNMRIFGVLIIIFGIILVVNSK